MRRSLPLLLAALAACARPLRSGDVPLVRAGVDPCARCGMIVSEERFASGYVDDAGRSVVFDDVGELLAAVRARPELRARAFVHDAADGRWLPAAVAAYRRIPALPTPMGSGWAAFRDEAQADSVQARLAAAAR